MKDTVQIILHSVNKTDRKVCRGHRFVYETKNKDGLFHISSGAFKETWSQKNRKTDLRSTRKPVSLCKLHQVPLDTMLLLPVE